MNRKQRREMKKQGIDVPKTPTYNLNWDDMIRIKKEATQEAYDDAVTTAMTLLLSIPVMVGMKKYGWTSEEMEWFCNDVLEEYERFNSGEKSLEEYQKFVYEQCGIRFEKKVEE